MASPSPPSSPHIPPEPEQKPDPPSSSNNNNNNNPKKPQPIPWTHTETLALIEAYKEKWYSLKKGQLKAHQWDQVASSVPTKTPTQCRHKIEKLRKRYRSELKSRKPVPSSWPYFGLMYHMECGPFPLHLHHSSPIIINNNNINNNNASYGSGKNLAGISRNDDADADADDSVKKRNYGGDVDDVDDEEEESDDEWNVVKKSKLKSINHIVLDNVKRGVRSARRVPSSVGGGGGDNRFARMLRNQMNGKRKKYYDGDGSDEEEEEENEVKEEEQEVAEDEMGGGGRGRGRGRGGGKELAAEIRGFADSFMRMENKKIEMMRETERYRMEMEKKRMEMILEAQRKIVDTIGWAFGDHNKRSKMEQES